MSSPSRPNPSRLTLVASVALVSLALTAPSCASRHTVAPTVTPPEGPQATSPTLAVQRLAWALRTRDVSAYNSLLTDDYVFFGLTSDSIGSGERMFAFDRTLDSASTRHMLIGGGTIERAADLGLEIDDHLYSQADWGAGMDPRWHRTVYTGANLTLSVVQDGTLDQVDVWSYSLFHLVRGDSAFFLPGRTAARDSTHWYVARWEDEVAGMAAVQGRRVLPARSMWLYDLKLLYLPETTGAR